MTKWDLRFLDLAHLVASWSKDPSTKVGAVITDRNRIVSLGFNGFPRGVPDDPSLLAEREAKLRVTIHAEANAILFARRDLRGMTIYATQHPCAACTSLIVQTGISRVVWIADDEFEKRWARDVELSRWLMEQAGIEAVPVRL